MEIRTCKVCAVTKILDKTTWLVQRGRFAGNVCRACNNAAKLRRQKHKRETDEAYRQAQNKATLAYMQKRLAKDPAFKAHVRSVTAECNKRRYAEDLMYANKCKKRSSDSQKARRLADNAYRLLQNKKALEYQRNNAAAQVARSMLRQAKKQQRTPKWLTKDDLVAMRLMYETARDLTIKTGIEHQVDHIIPLRGKYVSGLHVPSNLQIITAAKNKVKGNIYLPE